ncbi:MAG: hypothetical protein KAS32_19195 [Candidatus Peribacteraceae bacterium]|nr:hypothetical protein [Candidatus Peribacteraceae bacterium]
MAITRTLSNPAVEVNDQTISIIPNSLSFKKGQGDKGVKAQSAGGDAIEVVVTENAETKISMVKFKLFNTKVNFDLVNAWVGNISGNTIRLSEGELIESFRSMIVTTEPERAVGADGELEIEFMGQPVL